jgi:HSP20 family protein
MAAADWHARCISRGGTTTIAAPSPDPPICGPRFRAGGANHVYTKEEVCMLATRWQPFTSLWGDFGRLHDEMSRLFDAYRFERGWPSLAVAYPALNVWEDSDNIYVEAELPGLSHDDLEIYVTGGNQLTIKGERKLPQADPGVWHRQERGFGNFVRVLTLPSSVDPDRVEATFVNGVMTITMPKAEAHKPRRITVKAQ